MEIYLFTRERNAKPGFLDADALESEPESRHAAVKFATASRQLAKAILSIERVSGVSGGSARVPPRRHFRLSITRYPLVSDFERERERERLHPGILQIDPTWTSAESKLERLLPAVRASFDSLTFARGSASESSRIG